MVRFSHRPVGTMSSKQIEHRDAGVNRDGSDSARGLLELCLSHCAQIPSFSHFPEHRKTKTGASIGHSPQSAVFTLNVPGLGAPQDSVPHGL